MTILLFLLVLIGVGMDQATKFWISSQWGVGEGMEIITGFFSFHHVVNTGAAWSLFAHRSWGIYALTALSTLAGIALLWALHHFRFRSERIPLILLAAGCWGNWMDRVFRRGVIDFLSFQFGPFSFPVFNLADVFLVLGVLVLAGQMLMHKEGQND